MKKIRQFLATPWATGIIFAAAIALISIGSIGGARAAELIESNFYTAGMELYDIGVTLTENGVPVGSRNYVQDSNYVWDETKTPLLQGMLEESGGELQIGRAYTEELGVTNSGTIDAYVRASVYRYWVDANGNKIQTLTPEMIDLEWVNTCHSNDGITAPWVIDDNASTPERTMLYYRSILTGSVSDLAVVRRDSELFSSTLTVNPDIPYTVKQEREGNKIITTYVYDQASFMLEVTVDAVQTHHAADAMYSAWGLSPADIARLGIAIAE